MIVRHFFVLTLSLCFFACSDGDEAPGPTTDTASAKDHLVGGDDAFSSTCPPPLDEFSCEEKIFWAKNPDTGECCMYMRPCTTPVGWAKFELQEVCEDNSPSRGGCPPAKGDLPEEMQCEEKQVWAYVEEIDACCEYDGSCMIPFGLEQYDVKEPCEALVTRTNVQADCPDTSPQQALECEEKIVWAKNNQTGTCCKYTGFCKVPQGWETYKDSDTCENDAQ